MKTAIFLYKPEHVRLLEDRLSKKESAFDVLACGADIELLLGEENIRYRSLKDARTLSTADRLTYAGNLGEQALRSPQLSFFSHKGVHLGALLLPALQYYLGTFIYYFNIAEESLKGYEQIVIPAAEIPQGVGIGMFEAWNARACIDAVELVCAQQGISCERVAAPLATQTLQESVRAWMFSGKRAAFSTALFFFNILSRLIRRPKPIRILASELWKNIAPLMDRLPESELVLLDRAELFQIGVWRALRHRMCFLHINQYLTRSMRRKARSATGHFKQEWRAVKEEHLQELGKVTPIKIPSAQLETVLDHCILLGERLVREVEAAWAMLEQTRPQIVMVRAGISAQTHFAMLCEIARLQGIPSLEVQHGILSGAPHDFTRNPSSEYIAEYGPIVREELEKARFAPRSTFVDVGSPRFDALIKTSRIKAPRENNRFRLLHVGPQLTPGGWNDSYDVAEYFGTLGKALKGFSNVEVVIKLRATRIGESFFRACIENAFSGTPHTIVIFESIHKLLSEVDAVVSYHSTVVLEALLAKKPLIIDATLPIYRSFSRIDFATHEAEGALIVAESVRELTSVISSLVNDSEKREILTRNAQAFVDAHYLLSDERSSERLADLVRSLAKR